MNDSKRGLAAWINCRLGGDLLGGFLNRTLPDETGLPHTLGRATLFLLVVQVVTGIVLAMNYSPAPEPGRGAAAAARDGAVRICSVTDVKE